VEEAESIEGLPLEVRKMSAVLCVTCGKPIEGFVVTDPETGKTFHAGCVPKVFREEAKAQRKVARENRVPQKTRNKMKRAEGKMAREVESAQKWAAKAGVAKDKVRETYQFMVDNGMMEQADAILEKYQFSLTD
jgi:hypothetical protein